MSRKPNDDIRNRAERLQAILRLIQEHPISRQEELQEFLSAEDERERALSLAARRRLTGKNDYQKLVRFLCARGFAVSLSTSVAREVLAGHGFETPGPEA